jgi:hypothetical protein
VIRHWAQNSPMNRSLTSRGGSIQASCRPKNR